MNTKILNATAMDMVALGKGILAADESSPTIKKRFDTINVKSTEQTRNSYRDMLLTSKGIENYISGVILFDETLRQSTLKDGIPFAEHLSKLGIIPGIKVDMGAKPLAGMEGEKITEGLDGLRARLIEYKELGARFAKWRAVITIGEDSPSNTCISVNANALARYAALCQEQDIVPIVEPEILMDGIHTIADSFDVTEEVLHAVFYELYLQDVLFEGMVLKPNMVLSGYDGDEQASVEEVAEQTVACLKRTVPAAVPGIAFLSGGQSDALATAHLDTMNKILKGSPKPWNLTFSYGRALQAPSLKAWQGKSDRVSAGQNALVHRAKLNSLATLGQYDSGLE
ncbi:class I fructose-bisphosphate aldolase [Candidatus Neomarinimicrobiota bacterium]